jgi:ABC-2 type transport system ATP-binding protein
MISRGRVLALGTIHELMDRIWKVTPVEIEFLTPPPAEVIRSLQEIDGLTIGAMRENTLTLQVTKKELVPLMIRAAVTHGGEIVRVTPRDYSLEEIYFAVQEGGRGS